MVVEKLKEKIRLSREELISKRSIIERDIAEFKESINRLSDTSKAELAHVDLSRLDARILFPSLYDEKFDYERHNIERQEYALYMQPFLNLRKKLMEEAMTEMQVAI